MQSSLLEKGNGHYAGVDGLRVYSMLGIISMHVLEYGDYPLQGFVFKTGIPSLTNLVFVFITISGFSMCCGYYDKFKEGKIDLNKFYKSRFQKIWPFFALMCLMDFITAPSQETSYELFADLTLLFGLLPNANISVIGVGWTLGVIFAYYLLFPFFVFLLHSKRRGWFALGIAILMSWACDIYFFDASHVVSGFSARSNTIYCSMFFLAGGLVYLYRDLLRNFSNKYIWIMLPLLILSFIAFMLFPTNRIGNMIFSIVWLIYGLRDREVLLINSITKKVSKISFEIYLCHMMVLRILIAVNLCNPFKNHIISYVFTVILVTIGAMIFVLFYNRLRLLSTAYIQNRVYRRR